VIDLGFLVEVSSQAILWVHWVPIVMLDERDPPTHRLFALSMGHMVQVILEKGIGLPMLST